MKKYRKKPIIIEAIQWTGNNPIQIISFMGVYARFDERKDLYIKTLENVKNEFEVGLNDYIIKGVQGEFYACSKMSCLQAYEEVLK